YKPAAMSDACSDGICAKYHRKCDSAAEPKSCDFTIIGRPNPIHVEADSAQHFVRAMNALGVIVNTKGGTVRLSAMSAESADTNPYCSSAPRQPIDPACITAPYLGP